MKRNILNGFIFAALVGALAATPAFAQKMNGVSVPVFRN
jgi:hypothetical protein